LNPAAPISIRQTDGSIVFTGGGLPGFARLSLVYTSLRGTMIQRLESSDPPAATGVGTWTEIRAAASGPAFMRTVYRRAGRGLRSFEGTVTVGR